MIKLQQPTFSEPTDIHTHEGEPIVIHARQECPATDLVLFVHGLTGHRYGYWGHIPQYLLDDLPSADVGLYFYRTAWKRIGLGRSINIEDEARVLADALGQVPREYQAIAIVGHSMGGILAKAAIVDLINRSHRRTLRRITGLVLLASPQLGSRRVPRFLQALSRDGRALFPHNKTLQRIDTVFSSQLSIDRAEDPLDKYNIPTWAIVAAEDFWVDALSAGIGVPEEQKLTVRGSHGSIIRPSAKSNDPYVFLLQCLSASFGPIVENLDAEEIVTEDARPEDAAEIRKLAVHFFGPVVTPENVLRDFAARGGIFRVVKRVIASGGDRRERFSGYFCVIPLSAEAAAAVKAGTLRGGDITVYHLPADSAQPAALYIGAVAALDQRSRAVVLEALRLHVRYATTPGVQVLARPFTEAGLRRVKDHLFHPLGQEGIGELYALDSPVLRPNRMQAH